jgi:hypothetical protein
MFPTRPHFPAKAATQALCRKAPRLAEKAWTLAFAGQGGSVADV